MKRLLTLTTLLLVAMVSFAHDFEVGGIYYKITSSSSTPPTVEVSYRGTSYTSYSKEYTGSVTIPKTVTYSGVTYSVTSISDYAFYYCTGLTSVTIPSSITSIGVSAFYDCYELTNINIPNSVTSIGSRAFYCSGLTSISIGNSVKTIGDEAFRGCSGITSIILPDVVTSIGYKAFMGCSLLASITIPNLVSTIGSNTFEKCIALTSVSIGNSVTTIGDEAFKSCSSLTNVTIPSSVTTIGSNTFRSCSALKSITIPNTVTSLGSGAFSNCSSLTSVTLNNETIVSTQQLSSIFSGSKVKEFIIGENVTAIGNYAFRDCSELTSVTIPNSVTTIGSYAFSGCSGLTSINIGNSVKTIGSYAFQHCTELKRVIVKDIAAWCNITFGDKNVSNPLYYAHSIYSDENTEITHLVIPENVKSINAYAFVGCTGLKSVTFESGDITVDRNAFYQCAISEYYIPKGSLTAFKVNKSIDNVLRATSDTHIYEMDGDNVWSETIFGVPNDFTTYYDCDGDGVMEYLSGKTKDNNTVAGFFDRYGNLKLQTGNSTFYNYSSNIYRATPINGNGDLLCYWDYFNRTYYSFEMSHEYTYTIKKIDNAETLSNVSGSLLLDVDNDGRKDLIGDYNYPDKSFTIYYQQEDGSFKAIKQSATLDAEAAAKEANKSGGIVSFAVGMMVGGGGSGNSSPYFNYLKGLDINEDGILDMLDMDQGGILYSYADNKYLANSKKGVLYPCDLNNDGEFDYICNDGNNIILMTRTGSDTYDEKTLFTNSNVKQVLYKDFDHDGDIDILVYINDARGTSEKSGNTYFVFFRNDGDMSFKRRERNFAVNYDLLEIKDVDADGLYEMVVIDYTNKLKKILRISEDLTVTESNYDLSDGIYDNSIAIGDFDNDGKVDCRYLVGDGTKYGRFSDAVNSAPDKMEKPTAVLDAEAQRLRINWKQGKDKETSSCDLTYELRIGTEPASGNVLFGASLADGSRRTLEDGNMGRSLSTLFNAKSLKSGKYYISVQAVDAGGRGGAWSDDFVYEHQLAAPVIVSNYTQHMSTADTIRLSVKAPVDGAEYKWTVSEGRQIESDGLDTRFVFEHDGKHTVNLAMTYDGRTLNAEPLTLQVSPLTAKYVSSGYVDINQDGYPEYLGYVNNGKGIMEKVLLSYATQYSHYGGKNYIMDFNMDGYPDVLYSSDKVLINLGEQDNDFDVTTEEINLNNAGNLYFDANNDGYLDTSKGYNNGTNRAWNAYTSTDSKYAMRDNFDNVKNWDYYSQSYTLGSPNYDVNRDGMLDIVTRISNTLSYEYNKRWYVMYKDSTANISYTSPQLMYEEDIRGNDWYLEDINNDGYVDIIFNPVPLDGTTNPTYTLVIVKGGPTLPYKERVTYDFPSYISIKSLHDYNNDGYVDVLLEYKKDGSSTNALAEFGPDFSMKLVDLDAEPSGDYFMVQKDGGYPDGNLSHIKNQSPSAPASVAAKQTKDGMLITWSDAEDDHTPAMQMRYNISVKRKGKKGDNSFVISPMNGLIDKATICGTVMYKKSTQMLVPASVLTAGETYEIQVQAIDLWNQHSPMTKAVEFTMTSNGYIDVCEQVATDKETTVKFVGTQAGSYSLNAGDGATIVSDKGNGEYTVKWATEGVKDIMLTAGDATVKSSVTVVKPIDLAFAVPASVFAKAPLTIEVSDEMAKAAKNVGLRCSDSKVKIDYVIGSKTANITFPATGTYTLEAYSTDEVNGNTYSQVVKVTADMPKAIISQVDVDAATGSYAVCWETDALPAGISKVVVSKEGSRLGQFNEIGTVNAASGRYVDLSSNASVMASRYCIQLIASNGQKSEESAVHKPLHVMIAKAVKGYNLIWNGYEGLNVESYNIMRGSSPENMQMIEQVAGSVNSYTDTSAPAGVSYYAVTFEAQKDAPHQNSLNTVTGTGTEDAVSSNIISTEDAVDIVEAQSLELIVLDEDATLNDGHKELQLYYMILPTYATISKVKWEITGGSDIATIDANGVLHATGGDGTVKVRVATLDGSDLNAEISVPCSVFIDDDHTSVKIEEASTETTLKEKRYFTIDGKQVTAPVSGQPYVEWSIYSNGQIVSRKVMNR